MLRSRGAGGREYVGPRQRMVERLAREVRVPRVIARLLLSRGLGDPDAARRFLQPKLRDLHDPGLLKGCDAAVEALLDAIRRQRRVVIYGDYDVDGVTSTALLLRFLAEVGLEAEYYIPQREREGYGLNVAAIDQIAAGGPGLLVTVDHGVSAAAEVMHAVARP